jgi:hypothetical protein
MALNSSLLAHRRSVAISSRTRKEPIGSHVIPSLTRRTDAFSKKLENHAAAVPPSRAIAPLRDSALQDVAELSSSTTGRGPSV